MSGASQDRQQAAQLPQGDVIRVLLEQHARIQDLFAQLQTAAAEQKQHVFDELRRLLAVHEVAEEMIVRPVTRQTDDGGPVAEARNKEEDQATHTLAQLEKMDVSSSEFDMMIGRFKSAVVTHAEHEENEEFPRILSSQSEGVRQKMGMALQMAEKTAPTHPHPSAAGSTVAQYIAGPFASLLDHARDVVHKVMADSNA